MVRLVSPDDWLVIAHDGAKGRRAQRLTAYLCDSQVEANHMVKTQKAKGLTVRSGSVRDLLGP